MLSPLLPNELWSLDFVSDQLTSNAILTWAEKAVVESHYIAPGKPTDNGLIEDFSGKLHAECLNTHWFMSLDDARAKIEDWRRDYNEVRPHGAIGNKPQVAFVNGIPAVPPRSERIDRLDIHEEAVLQNPFLRIW